MKFLPFLLLPLSGSVASAAIVATGDTFATNTTANYTVSGGYALSYIATGSTNFGDGTTDGLLGVSVPGSNTTGLLRHTLGTVELSDVGKELTLTFRVDGRSANFHSDRAAFTVGGTTVLTGALSTSGFTEWDSAGSAPVVPAATLGDWRNKNGVGSITYTIQAADVGSALGWEFDAQSTSSGGYGFGIDNWELAVVPEPSGAALAPLVLLGLCAIRRRPS